MSAQATRRWSFTGLHLLLILLAVVVLVAAYMIGSATLRVRESARMAVPAMAALDATSKEMAGHMAGGGGMAAGGRAGAGARMAGGGSYGGAPAEGLGMPGGGAAMPPPTSTPGFTPAEPMLIRTATLRVRVQDVPKAHAEVVRIASEAKGYIADTTLSSEEGPTYAVVTIRVPGKGLDSVVDRLAALGKVLRKQISAQEVTEEYVDLTSRRRNLEREETRLLELLQRAGKVSDLLQVETTLARVRGEIEQIAGRMRYLENRVSLSTVTVHLQGPEREPTAGGPVWAASDVFRQAARSLLGTARGLATMAIWLAIYAVIWVPIALVVVWLVRRMTRGAAERLSAGS